MNIKIYGTGTTGHQMVKEKLSEISEQLKISENTSKTQLMKAKNMLRNKIEAAFK